MPSCARPLVRWGRRGCVTQGDVQGYRKEGERVVCLCFSAGSCWKHYPLWTQFSKITIFFLDSMIYSTRHSHSPDKDSPPLYGMDLLYREQCAAMSARHAAIGVTHCDALWCGQRCGGGLDVLIETMLSLSDGQDRWLPYSARARTRTHTHTHTVHCIRATAHT